MEFHVLSPGEIWLIKTTFLTGGSKLFHDEVLQWEWWYYSQQTVSSSCSRSAVAAAAHVICAHTSWWAIHCDAIFLTHRSTRKEDKGSKDQDCAMQEGHLQWRTQDSIFLTTLSSQIKNRGENCTSATSDRTSVIRLCVVPAQLRDLSRNCSSQTKAGAC